MPFPSNAPDHLVSFSRLLLSSPFLIPRVPQATATTNVIPLHGPSCCCFAAPRTLWDMLRARSKLRSCHHGPRSRWPWRLRADQASQVVASRNQRAQCSLHGGSPLAYPVPTLVWTLIRRFVSRARALVLHATFHREQRFFSTSIPSSTPSIAQVPLPTTMRQPHPGCGLWGILGQFSAAQAQAPKFVDPQEVL
jgi:hypothetical protein